MIDQFILSLAVISQISGTDLAHALEETKQTYIVPTIEKERFEWTLEHKIRTEYSAPKKISEDVDADVSVRSAFIMDANTQQILWQKDPEEAVPMASISKLMSMMVWLEHQPAQGFDAVYTMTPEDDTPGGKELNLSHGSNISTNDLFHASLVASYNDTVMALMHSSPLSEEEFIDAMNIKAAALGMENAQFVEPTGLSEENRATVSDIAKMARAAFATPEIEEAVTQDSYTFRVEGEDFDRSAYTTDQLLYDTDLDVIAGKTGYTEEAGYCLVVKAREPNSGREVIAVVLGADSEEARFEEMKQLIQWTFTNYAW